MRRTDERSLGADEFVVGREAWLAFVGTAAADAARGNTCRDASLQPGALLWPPTSIGHGDATTTLTVIVADARRSFAMAPGISKTRSARPLNRFPVIPAQRQATGIL